MVTNVLSPVEQTNLELLVHVAAPTSVLEDHRYRSRAAQAVRFIPVTQLRVGSISWPVNIGSRGRQSMVGDRSLARPSNNLSARKRRKTASSNKIVCSHLPNSTPYTSIKEKSQQDAIISSTTEGDSETPPACQYKCTAVQSGIHETEVLPSVISHEASRCMPGISTSSVLNSKRLHITSDYTKCIQSQAVDQPISTCSPAESISISPTQFPPLSTGPLIQILAPAPRLESFDLPPYFSPTTPSQTTVDSLSSLSQLHVRVPAFSPLMPIPSIVSGPFTIYAPRPERLSNPPQVPEMISKVIEDPKRGLIDRYGKSLQFQRRELRQWERGYWQMDLSGWGDQKKKIFFWNNVVDNVSKGRWGMVNVSLGTEESPGRYDGLDVEKMNPSLKSEFERKGNIVKIYCWGGAVKYIWAALYTFSWKRMDGAQWIDSHGEPVIICKV